MPSSSLNSGHEQRIAAGVSFDWSSLPPLVETLDRVAPDTTRLHFRRRGRSPVGLAELRRLKELWLRDANQDALDAVAGLPDLETLSINGLAAADLGGLGKCLSLKRLIIHGGTKVESLDWVRSLPPVMEILYLEGFYRTSDVSPLASLPDLRSLGFEGGMDRKCTVQTLATLAGLRKLRALFLAATRIADGSLSALRSIATLERLDCMAAFPDEEFRALREALPGLQCDWFAMLDEHGSIRKGMAAVRQRPTGG